MGWGGYPGNGCGDVVVGRVPCDHLPGPSARVLLLYRLCCPHCGVMAVVSPLWCHGCGGPVVPCVVTLGCPVVPCVVTLGCPVVTWSRVLLHCGGWSRGPVCCYTGGGFGPVVVPLVGLRSGGSRGLSIGVHCVSGVDHRINRQIIWDRPSGPK